MSGTDLVCGAVLCDALYSPRARYRAMQCPFLVLDFGVEHAPTLPLRFLSLPLAQTLPLAFLPSARHHVQLDGRCGVLTGADVHAVLTSISCCRDVGATEMCGCTGKYECTVTCGCNCDMWCDMKMQCDIGMRWRVRGGWQVMSLCKHAITANSSFSWWAAYLGGAWEGAKGMREGKKGEGKGGVVVAPRVWFGRDGPGMEEGDFFPPEWILV
eukprot:1712369-Rhodomonas_salina.4